MTLLTSLSEEEWQRLGHTESIAQQVIRLAKLAKEAGLDGVVASPWETADIRQVCGEEFLIITPGIRPAGSEMEDQHRIATPAAALQNGATHIVVGRPIRGAKDPRAAAQAIIQEMKGILP